MNLKFLFDDSIHKLIKANENRPYREIVQLIREAVTRQHGNHSTILATKFDPDHDDPATFLQTKFVVFGQRAEQNDDDLRMWLTSSLPTDFEIREVDQTLLTDRLRIYVKSWKARSREMKRITDTVAKAINDYYG